MSRGTTAENVNSLAVPACPLKTLNTLPKPKILDGLKKELSSVSYIPFDMSSYSCTYLIGWNFMVIVYLILSISCSLLCHVNFAVWDTLWLHTNLCGTICFWRVTFFLLCQSFVTLPFIFAGKLLFTYPLFLTLSASFAVTNFLFNMNFSLAFNNFIRFRLLFIFTLLMMVFTIFYIVSYSNCITYCIFSDLSFMVSATVFSAKFLIEHQWTAAFGFQKLRTF